MSQSSSSSSNGENVSSVNSSSNIVISSSSVLYSSSSMNVIPQEFQTLIPYKLLSQENLIISDRVKLSGGSFGCSNANIGANAKIYGNLSVKKNVELRSNSYVQSLLYGSSLNAQHGASYGSAIKQTNIFPSIPTVNVIAGSNNIQVLNNKTITLSPSRYGKLHIYSNSNVYFEPGEYFFESVQIEPDVKLQFKNTISPIHLWIKNEFNYGDRVNALLEGQINNLFIYTGASNIYLGVSSSLNAILVAPNASVDMASRYKWLGKIWAKNITIQPDVNIE